MQISESLSLSERGVVTLRDELRRRMALPQRHRLLQGYPMAPLMQAAQQGKHIGCCGGGGFGRRVCRRAKGEHHGQLALQAPHAQPSCGLHPHRWKKW